MRLEGIHHVTAVSAEISRNLIFYTQKLGMRFVKKSINQDDVSAYHLFYADGLASPGTDLTFFDFPVDRERRGTNSITRTGLRLAGESTLAWWKEHFVNLKIAHGPILGRDGRLTLDFEDFEGQRLSLIDDGGAGDAHPWKRSSVPAEHQIRGLGPITISVRELNPTDFVLTRVLGMKSVRNFVTSGSGNSTTHVYQMGQGGPAAEIHVAVEINLPIAQPGAGGVHHVAFRIPDSDYNAWDERLAHLRIPSSGPVDRFYFRSLYFREPNGILFEIATDGPGFTADEPLESLGDKLSIPPFMEDRRREIEAGLKPL
jgi:glyoxalase family protein